MRPSPEESARKSALGLKEVSRSRIGAATGAMVGPAAGGRRGGGRKGLAGGGRKEGRVLWRNAVAAVGAGRPGQPNQSPTHPRAPFCRLGSVAPCWPGRFHL